MPLIHIDTNQSGLNMVEFKTLIHASSSGWTKKVTIKEHDNYDASSAHHSHCTCIPLCFLCSKSHIA